LLLQRKLTLTIQWLLLGTAAKVIWQKATSFGS